MSYSGEHSTLVFYVLIPGAVMLALTGWLFGGQGVGTEPESVPCGNAARVRTKHLMDQPVAFSTNLVTASAANTMVRWASMDSRL